MNMAVRVASLVFLCLVMTPTASAFCGGNYSDGYPLTQLDDYASPFLVNDTYGFDFGDGPQLIWCNATSDYLCYADSTDYACFKGDTEMARDVDEGNETDYGDAWDTELSLIHI